MVLNIFKIGGSVIDDENLLDQLISGLTALKDPCIVIHGGGTIASSVCRKMGIEPKMHEGRRITDAPTLKIAVMTYAGWVNKHIVAKLQSNGMNAIGLTGADGNIIEAHKRIPGDVDYGYAGDIDKVNSDGITRLIDSGFLPVIAPITHDCHGQLLNTNADTIAAEVSAALAGYYHVKLIYIMDHKGVLADINDDRSTIAEVNASEIDELLTNGIISAGMIPKLHNARNALKGGTAEVLLTNTASVMTLNNSRDFIEGTRITINDE